MKFPIFSRFFRLFHRIGEKLNALQYEGFILNLKIRLLAFRFNETTIDDVGRR